MNNLKLSLGVPIIAGSLLVLAAFQSFHSTGDPKSGIILENMDKQVVPGNNFMEYVNGTWIKKTEIPADKPSASVSSLINDKAQEDVKEIIEKAASGKFADGSEEQKIGDLYGSYMNMTARDAVGIKPLAADFKKIDGIKNQKELAAYFAYANKIGNMAPFSVAVTEDFKNPKNYMLLTWQGGLGLPDREYYFTDNAKSKEIRTKYVAHIEKMLTLAGITEAKPKASEIMALETLMASKQMKKEETRNMAGLYNKYAVSNLNTLMPDYDWKGMLNEAGVKNPDSIVVAQVAYTKDLNAIIKNTPLSIWKTYLKWSLVKGGASALNSALDEENFSFNGTILNGIPKQRPQWRRAVGVVNGSLGEMVGKLYVEKHFSPEAKARMLVLVGNLLKAYETSIKELDWMSPETKTEALKKISKFTPKIGYPDKWRDYSTLKIVKNDLYGNLTRSTAFEYNRMMKKLGTPVDRTEWGMTPQTVNAYYNPPLNEIVFPAAILQPPFFDMNAEDAVNYGGIGAVIGHEIGHGFDDQGSTFDGDGVMRDWWTKNDLSEFKKRTNALVAQYSGFKVLSDLNVNGEFTLGENIGDLGGLTIALKAYHASLNGKTAPVLDGFNGDQRVFIGWGQVWLNKSREQALRKQVGTDPHSPARFRVNGIVRNIPEFYTAFNVKPGDSLYLAPNKRVKIW
ncbi:putative endopeptidase [Pedobacter cryoconitis]|uniref:Putative endopeptidase n=1 Tax=Pedobacter cryoconitis TaxID=188932 RepID=A0A7W8YP35_9SPHI|nr:M13 family metallopeptidase [Pedobacter cryoconitis]MBB5619186.1 putative endopeptidase [Pedobacter cryoconitis]MBB5644481.1 putative endopeptidase [Pedobacter cryoconitis]